MGGKSSTPDAPDYMALAQQQGRENRDTSLFNSSLANPNLVTPYGSFSYSFGPSVRIPGSGGDMYGTGAGGGGSGQDSGGPFSDKGGGTPDAPSGPLMLPRPTAEFTLSPEQQALFNTNQQYQGLLGRSQIAGLGRYNDIMGNTGGIANSRRRVEDALYRSGQRFLDPRIAAGEAQLANEGGFRGGAAYNDFARQADEAYQSLADRSILAGGTEESRIQNQANQNLNLLNSLYRYQYPFANVNANSGGGAAPANIEGAGQNAYQAALNAANAHNAGSAGLFGDLLGAGSMLGSAFLLG